MGWYKKGPLFKEEEEEDKELSLVELRAKAKEEEGFWESPEELSEDYGAGEWLGTAAKNIPYSLAERARELGQLVSDPGAAIKGIAGVAEGAWDVATGEDSAEAKMARQVWEEIKSQTTDPRRIAEDPTAALANIATLVMPFYGGTRMALTKAGLEGTRGASMLSKVGRAADIAADPAMFAAGKAISGAGKVAGKAKDVIGKGAGKIGLLGLGAGTAKGVGRLEEAYKAGARGERGVLEEAADAGTKEPLGRELLESLEESERKGVREQGQALMGTGDPSRPMDQPQIPEKKFKTAEEIRAERIKEETTRAVDEDLPSEIKRVANEHKQALDAQKRLSDEFGVEMDLVQRRIDDLTSVEGKRIQKLRSERDKLPINSVGKRVDLDNEIARLEKELNGEIARLEREQGSILARYDKEADHDLFPKTEQELREIAELEVLNRVEEGAPPAKIFEGRLEETEASKVTRTRHIEGAAKIREEATRRWREIVNVMSDELGDPQTLERLSDKLGVKLTPGTSGAAVGRAIVEALSPNQTDKLSALKVFDEVYPEMKLRAKAVGVGMAEAEPTSLIGRSFALSTAAGGAIFGPAIAAAIAAIPLWQLTFIPKVQAKRLARFGQAKAGKIDPKTGKKKAGSGFGASLALVGFDPDGKIMSLIQNTAQNTISALEKAQMPVTRSMTLGTAMERLGVADEERLPGSLYQKQRSLLGRLGGN